MIKDKEEKLICPIIRKTLGEIYGYRDFYDGRKSIGVKQFHNRS